MPHWAFHQMDVVAAAFVVDFLDLFVVETVHLIGRAETGVLGIGVPNKLPRFLGRHIIDDIAAHLFGQRQLAVRESAGPRPAAHNIAGLAVHAAAGLARRAVPSIDRQALVHQQHIQLRCFILQFQSSKNAGRSGAHNDNVVSRHTFLSYSRIRRVGIGPNLFIILDNLPFVNCLAAESLPLNSG